MANVISGFLAYAKVTEPANKYQSDEKEFSVDIIVDKATAKAFRKQFPKQKGKDVDNADFEGIYKFAAPFPDQDEQCILKLKKGAQYKDGTELPKKYWPQLLKEVKGKAIPLDEGVLIGNGSKAKVSFDITENSYGTFAKLKAILVQDLVEYSRPNTNAAEDFGLPVETNTASDFEAPAPSPAPATSKAKAKKPSLEEMEDDVPF